VFKFAQGGEKLDAAMKWAEKTNSNQRCAPERAVDLLPKIIGQSGETTESFNDNRNAIFFSTSQKLHQWSVG
jgi:hypothetical protein